MLLHSSGPRPLLKLCDFGFSRVEVPSKQCDSSCGTPEYMAPEVLFEEVRWTTRSVLCLWDGLWSPGRACSTYNLPVTALESANLCYGWGLIGPCCIAL